MTTAKWYYRLLGADFGPVSFRELCDLKAKGIVSRETLVRPEDDDNWRCAEAIRELFGQCQPIKPKQGDLLDPLACSLLPDAENRANSVKAQLPQGAKTQSPKEKPPHTVYLRVLGRDFASHDDLINAISTLALVIILLAIFCILIARLQRIEPFAQLNEGGILPLLMAPLVGFLAAVRGTEWGLKQYGLLFAYKSATRKVLFALLGVYCFVVGLALLAGSLLVLLLLVPVGCTALGRSFGLPPVITFSVLLVLLVLEIIWLGILLSGRHFWHTVLVRTIATGCGSVAGLLCSCFPIGLIDSFLGLSDAERSINIATSGIVVWVAAILVAFTAKRPSEKFRCSLRSQLGGHTDDRSDMLAQ